MPEAFDAAARAVGRTGDALNFPATTTKANLAAVQRAAKARAAERAAKKTSRFKGVSYVKARGRRPPGWRAQIRIDRKQSALGTFADETEAAEAFDAAARAVGRTGDALNFPGTTKKRKRKLGR